MSMKSLKSCDTHSSEPLPLQQWDTSRRWSIYAPPVRHGCLSAHLSQTQWEEFQRICQHLEVSFEAWCTRWKCDLKPEMMQWCNGNIPTGFCHLHSHHTPAFFLVKVYSKPKCITRPVQRPKGPKSILSGIGIWSELTPWICWPWYNKCRSKCQCSHRWCQEVSPENCEWDMNGWAKDGGTRRAYKETNLRSGSLSSWRVCHCITVWLRKLVAWSIFWSVHRIPGPAILLKKDCRLEDKEHIFPPWERDLFLTWWDFKHPILSAGRLARLFDDLCVCPPLSFYHFPLCLT